MSTSRDSKKDGALDPLEAGELALSSASSQSTSSSLLACGETIDFETHDGAMSASAKAAMAADVAHGDNWPASVRWNPLASLLPFLAGQSVGESSRALDPLITLINQMARLQWKVSLAVVLASAGLLASSQRQRVPTICAETASTFVSSSLFLHAYFLLLYFLVYSQRGSSLRPASAATLPPEVIASRSATVVALYNGFSLVRLVAAMPWTRSSVDVYRMCTEPKNDPLMLSLPTYAATMLTLHAAAVVAILAAIVGIAHQQGALQELKKPEFYSHLRYRVNEEIASLPSVSELACRAARRLGCVAPPPAVADSTSSDSAAPAASKCPFASFAALGALCPHALVPITPAAVASPAPVAAAASAAAASPAPIAGASTESAASPSPAVAASPKPQPPSETAGESVSAFTHQVADQAKEAISKAASALHTLMSREKEASTDVTPASPPLAAPVAAAKSSPILAPAAAPSPAMAAASPEKSKSPETDDFVLVDGEAE